MLNGRRASALEFVAKLLNSPRFLPVLFFVYFGLRIAILFVQPLHQVSDFQWYYARAASMAAGHGYEEGGVLTAFWPVGWPAFLSIAFRIFGTSQTVGQLVNLTLAALVFPLTVRLGEALFNHRLVGRLAVFFLTFYPNQIAYVPILTTEIFFEVILLSGILLLMREKIAGWVLAGFVFGIATLTKSQSILLPGFMLAGRAFAGPSPRRLLQLAGAVGATYLAVLLVVAPWTYRNYEVFGAFVPVSTNGGWTLLTGNNPEARGDFTQRTVLAIGLSHEPSQQILMDRLTRDRAVDWIKSHPGRFTLLIPMKVFRLWAPDGEGEWYYQRGFLHYDNHVLLFRALRILNQVYYVFLILLSLASLLTLNELKPKSPWIMIGPIVFLYFSLISIAFSGQSRFHFSLMPLLVTYSAWTVIRWLDRSRRLTADGSAIDPSAYEAGASARS